MPNNNSSISQPLSGMVTDLNDLSMKPNQYSFCLNGTIENETGSSSIIQNDSSNILSVNYPSGYIVIGRKYIPEAQRTIVALLNTTTGKSEFGEIKDCDYDDNKEDIEGTNICCDEGGNSYIERKPLEETTQVPYCQYRTIINADCFNFNINYPIIIEYRITNYGVNIYFVDYFNPIRFIYFNYNQDNNLIVQDRFKIVVSHDVDNCNLAVYGTEIDCNKIKYNPDFSRPCVEFVDIVSGGNIKAGTIQFLTAYADINSIPLTKYFPATQPIPLRSKDITFETNYDTNKSVSIKLNNLENTEVFSYYNIVVAETVDNYTEFKLVATLPITQDRYTYTGNDNLYKNITANDIFFERPVYNTAASITKANDYLFLGKVKESKKMNLQRAANRIKLYWQTKAISETELKKPHNVSRYRSFMRDEVYPLGIVFELVDDNDTIAFHIPGPSKDYFTQTYSINVDSIISNNDVISDASCSGDNRNKLWQVYNTAKIIGTPHSYVPECNDNSCWEWGDFAYWESSRNYPNVPEVWGDLCGQRIRHAKFPDSLITHIHDGKDGSKLYNENNIVYPLGIKVDEDSIKSALAWAVSEGIITEEEKARIKGYRIVRGNRVGHKSIVAKGLLFDMWYYDKDGNRIYYPNFGYNDLRSNPYLAPNTDTYDEANDQAGNPTDFTKTGRYTFHSPDIHFTNPSLGTEFKIETEEYGQSEGFFNHCEEQPKYKLLSTAAYTLAFSFGIAAAISSLEEKECRTYTKKADYLTTQDDSQISSASFNGGQYIVGAGLTDISTTNAGGSIGSHSQSNPDKTEEHNRQSFNPFRRSDGSELSIPENVESVTYTTCKGSTYQVINSNSGLGGLGGFLSGIIGAITGVSLNGIIYRTVIGLREMQLVLDLFTSLVPYKNFAIQYNSAAKYNNYSTIANTGNKRRIIENSTYLTSDNQIVSDSTPVRINNWHRETSVYLKTDASKLFPDPTHVDNSRVIMDDINFEYDDLNKTFNRNVSSYYGAIKNYVPDQYGAIYTIDYLETNGCSFTINDDNNGIQLDTCTTLFGGDVFINRFALKRKHPFFLQTRFQSANDSDVLYQYLGNAAYPNFYFNTKQELFERLSELDIGDIFSSFSGFLGNVLNVPKSRLDAKVESSFFYQKGYIHLYHYGIPYFLVESDVNVDYRHGENNTDKDYYPHNTDLNNWLQEKYVPIQRDNFFGYNKSYSKQNKESAIQTIKPQSKFNDEKAVTYNNRIIYTERNKNLLENDNWLILKGNNFYDNDLSKGSIISVDGIENSKVLIRCENGTQIFNAFDTLTTSAGQVQVGKAGMFETRPQDFAVTDLGFMGSQHRDIVKSEFGHLWTDAKRGQLFLLGSNGQGIDELGKYGMRNWFKQNLPFQLLKDFPTINSKELDNNFKGVGLHLGFDKRFNRFFITKLDYKKKRNDIILDNGDFYIAQNPVSSCPTGYSLVDGKCQKITDTPATQTNNLPAFVPTSKKALEYSAAGTALYSVYAENGTGTFEYIDNAATNNYWINTPINSYTGPLNRSGIWNSLGDDPYNEWVGISVEINVPETKVYYIGIAADNTARIKIGCDTIVSFDPIAMSTNHNASLQTPFIFWHIYPVVLQKGKQFVELAGLNYGSIAVFGAQIYNNTATELKNAKSDDDLDIIFSTDSLIGQSLSNFNYSCPDCNPLVKSGNSYLCRKIEYADPVVTVHRTKINISDPLYFINKSWTISFNFENKSWVSYHSFVPNYYIDKIDNFETGLNKSTTSSLWSHNVTNKSFQVYYGKLYPFSIDVITEPSLQVSYLNSIEFMSDTLRYHNEYNWFYNRNITFTKAIVYNERQNSGVLPLIPKNEDDFSTVGLYPRVTSDGTEIEISNSQNIWSFNGFYDMVSCQQNNTPIWINSDNNADKVLNQKAFDYNKDEFDLARLRGRNFHLRLINDKWSNYKILFHLTQFNKNISFR